MRISASRPHLGGNPDRLHQFLARGTLAECRLRVSSDAIRALRNMCHRNRDQLLGLCRQRAVGEDFLTERLKSFLYVGSKGPAFLGKLS